MCCITITSYTIVQYISWYYIILHCITIDVLFYCVLFQRDYCESYELANCTTQHIKDTCCELCGEYNVPTTTVQPCVRDADHPECGIIDLSLSLCYDSTFYFLCCNKCNSLRKDYYPSGESLFQRSHKGH